MDTNVLVAALIGRGVCAEFLDHCLARHRVVTSEFILGELGRTLRRKFGFAPQDAEDASAMLRASAEVIDPPALDQAVCRDPDDDAVLALTSAGCATCLVTGDRDLLVLGVFRGAAIVAPADFPAFEASRMGS